MAFHVDSFVVANETEDWGCLRADFDEFVSVVSDDAVATVSNDHAEGCCFWHSDIEGPELRTRFEPRALNVTELFALWSNHHSLYFVALTKNDRIGGCDEVADSPNNTVSSLVASKKQRNTEWAAKQGCWRIWESMTNIDSVDTVEG